MKKKQVVPSAEPSKSCLVRNLSRGQRRPLDPAGTRACSVEARGSCKNARQVTALHHGQLAVHIGEADGSLVPRLGESGMGGFAEELHGPGRDCIAPSFHVIRGLNHIQCYR
jgi:hypothetical protein